MAEQEVFGMLHLLASMLMGVAAAWLLHRCTTALQRLSYAGGINIRLVLLGMWGGFAALMIPLLFSAWGMNMVSASWWRAAAATLVNWLVLYTLVVRPKHYINRFDLVIYSTCVAMGHSMAATLLMDVIPSSWLFTGVFQVLRQFSYQVLMAVFLMKAIDCAAQVGKRRLYLALAWLAPALLQGLQQTLLNGSPAMLRWFVEGALPAAALGVVWVLSQRNKRFPGVDAQAVLEQAHSKPGLRQRLAYRFDTLMGRGNMALIGVLFGFSMLLIGVVALVVYWKVPQTVENQLGHALWTIGMRVLDSGSVATDIKAGNALYISMTMLSTLFGLILMSSLIGLISNMLTIKLQKLRDGRTRVLEKDHVLFLGYSDDVPVVLEHLLQGKRWQQRLPVVLVDDMPREALEAGVSFMLHWRRGIRIVFRRGSITDGRTLALVNLRKARHIVISGEDGRGLACALAVKNMLVEGLDGQVSLLLSRPQDNLAAASYLKGIRVVYANDLSFAPILRSLSQKDFIPVYSALTRTSRETLLSAEPAHPVAGQGFYGLPARFLYSSVCGLMRQGHALMAPEPDCRVERGDELIFLKNPKDRPMPVPATAPEPLPQNLLGGSAPLPGVERMLVIGTRGLDSLLQQLSQLAAPPALHKMARYHSEQLKAACAAQRFDLVLCLGEDGRGAEASDAALMPYLLLLRALTAGRDTYLCANLETSAAARYAYEQGIADYVLQDDRCRLVAADILRENSRAWEMEHQLFFSGDGLQLVAADALADQRLHIAGLTAALAQRQRMLVGFLSQQPDGRRVWMNPNKNEHHTFQKGDCLIVTGGGSAV